MDNFTERMLERTHRRQELLASASLEVPLKRSSPPPVVETLPSIQKLPSPPPPQRMRRNRFAELASRVDIWLEEDTDIKPKSKENDLTAKFKSRVSQQAVNKSTTVSSLGPLVPEEKLTTSNKNTSTFTQQPKPQLNKFQKLHQRQKSPDNKLPPQWQSSNSTETTLTVAQRRALFEQNIAAQQQIKKPTTTTVFTISLTKTTTTKSNDTTATVAVEKEDNEPVLEVITTPPRPIPCSKTTPPSRRGTRPRESPAAVALGKLSPKSRNAWTPPCIKNVLLKKQLITELDDDQSKMPETEKTGTTVATSSPLGITAISPADRIAMSVGRVRFMSPSSSSLYPDLSLIENDNDDGNKKDTITSPLDNQYTGFKRRSNGSSALNTSTASSVSLYDNADDEMLGAKRSRCESKPTNDTEVDHNAKYQDASLTAVTTIQESSHLVTVATNTPSSSFSSSMLSDHRADQTCVSFTYYGPEQNLPLQCPQLNEEKSQGNNKGNSIEPTLVHTVSTYRKQQKQLRINGKSSSKQHTGQLENEDEEDKYSRSALLRQRLKLLDDDDDEEIKLQELEMVAERARNLERTVVPEQDRIIEQATQALNICDMYRQKNGLRPVVSSKFSPEHVHAERLLLIAGLRRTDAVREAQRLRVERTLLPGGKHRQFKIQGNGKTLVIESLRVPILSSVVGGSNKGTENLTRWPGGYRYFVCAIRAAATGYRPPVTSATRPADAVEESVLRFSAGNPVSSRGSDGIDFGYIEFITKKQIKFSGGGRKCPMPTEAEGAPIMIHGLDDEGWKITVELYGLSPTAATGEHDHHNSCNNSKEHDGHENIKSVLDKFWSTVTTPSKESKKHATTASTCIESPGGPMAVRNTVFRQLGYFVFSDRQVDRQQFTLNKVHQSGIAANTSKTVVEETVRVDMCLLEDGEQYIYDNDEDSRNFDNPLLGSNKYTNSGCAMVAARKPLTFPSECKRTEGFLTLFDDHELRATPTFEQAPKWQRHSNIKSSVTGGTTLWRRLWFRIEIIDDPKQQQEIGDNSCAETQKQQQINRHKKTIVLRYWLYPEHAEQQREPIGSIDLNRCLPLPPPKAEVTAAISEQQQQKPVPAAPALPDLCARPNTLRLLLYSNSTAFDNDYGDVINGVDDPLLLSADTADERREWCDTVNGAVRVLGEHRKWIKIAETARLNQKQEKDNEEHKQRLQNEQRTGAWPPISSAISKSCGKKKKLYK